MIIDSIRDYFISCPVLDAFRKINVDYLDPDEPAYTIDPIPGETTIKTYVDGARLKQYLFVIASREFYSSDVDVNIENSGFYEQLESWLEEQSFNDKLPVLSGKRRSQSLQVLTSGYLFNATEDRARYQIQVRLTYYEGR